MDGRYVLLSTIKGRGAVPIYILNSMYSFSWGESQIKEGIDELINDGLIYRVQPGVVMAVH